MQTEQILLIIFYATQKHVQLKRKKVTWMQTTRSGDTLLVFNSHDNHMCTVYTVCIVCMYLISQLISSHLHSCNLGPHAIFIRHGEEP